MPVLVSVEPGAAVEEQEVALVDKKLQSDRSLTFGKLELTRKSSFPQMKMTRHLK